MKAMQFLSKITIALCAATAVSADERPAALIIAQGVWVTRPGTIPRMQASIRSGENGIYRASN